MNIAEYPSEYSGSRHTCKEWLAISRDITSLQNLIVAQLGKDPEGNYDIRKILIAYIRRYAQQPATVPYLETSQPGSHYCNTPINGSLFSSS
jgi:hypothetical protein